MWRNYTFYYSKSIAYLFALLLLAGCEFDPEEPVPGYLYIKEAHMRTIRGQGAPTHLIKDVWVIIDSVGEHGIYPVGGRIPVIANGPKKVDLFPGIRVNGVKNESVIYEPYKPIFLQHDYTPGQVDTIELEFSYTDRAKFPLIEDFESSVNWVSLDTNKQAIRKWEIFPSSDSIYGTRSGRITLLKDSIRSKVALVNGKWIPSDAFTNKKVYMEVDVKSADAQMALGFQIKDGSQYFKTLNAFILPDSIGAWRKFYFDFTTVLKPGANKYFRVLFFASLDTAVFKQADIFVDNLKIVTY